MITMNTVAFNWSVSHPAQQYQLNEETGDLFVPVLDRVILDLAGLEYLLNGLTDAHFHPETKYKETRLGTFKILPDTSSLFSRLYATCADLFNDFDGTESEKIFQCIQVWAHEEIPQFRMNINAIQVAKEWQSWDNEFYSSLLLQVSTF